MDSERLISILCAQQWEKCKGELMALVALQGSRNTQYEGNKAIVNSQWKKLLEHVECFVLDVEQNELNW